MLSGIRLNLKKSNLYGIGVIDAHVEVMIVGIGCIVSSVPFHYHDLPVGEKMNHKDKGGMGIHSLKAFRIALLIIWK